MENNYNNTEKDKKVGAGMKKSIFFCLILTIIIGLIFSSKIFVNNKHKEVVTNVKEEEEDNIFYIYYKDEEIGSFSFYTFNFDIGDIYFHSFNIYEEFQNKGLGKLSMRAILLFLENIGKTKIHLQLLLENTPAYKIYKDLGFSISSEISYYKKFIQ